MYNFYTGTEVIGIYAVYIDVFLAQNVLMDLQLLLLTLLLLKEKIILPRLLAASLAGGAGAVMILLSGMGYGAAYIAAVLLLDMVMLLVCMRKPARSRLTFQKLMMGIIYLHGMVFAYGKLMECAGRLVGERMAQILVTGVIAGIVGFMLAYRRLAESRHIYEVTLTQEEENVVCRALFDTGNLLVDPVSGKPVSVVEETDLMRGWMEKYPQKYRIIPYQSVGEEHGLLEGIVVDELMIQKEQERVVKRGAVIAFYKGRLSKDGAFQMILNHSLMI